MKNPVFHLFFVALVGILFAGCTNYRPLTLLPEYPHPDKKFNTTASLYLYPCREAQVNPELRRAFRRYGYVNLLGELPDRAVDPDRAKVVLPLDFTQEVIPQKEGDYLETRIIVAVRAPGEVRNGRLEYPGGHRLFQARSRLFLGQRPADDSVHAEEMRHVLENLFTIPEFRSALEP